MARPRFQRMDPVRREALLEAAAKEFAQVGYEGASINRILGSLGLSKGAFYYYFDDKADLAATVLVWVFRDVLDLYTQMRLPEDRTEFWDAIGQIATSSMALLENAPYADALSSRLGHAFANDGALSERVRQASAQTTSALVNIWARGQALGAVRSDISAPMLITLCQGIKEALIRAYLPEARVLSRAELERLTSMNLDLIRRDSEPGERQPR
jgi:AcrR family transcriptional regulator